MNHEATLYMPLASAWLCQDCNSIGNRSGSCPACASSALLSLSAILNRDTAEDELERARRRAIVTEGA